MAKTLYSCKTTWLNYMETLKFRSSPQEKLELTGLDDFFNANPFANSFFRYSIPYVYLLDYKRGMYINMSENFGGYRSASFLEKGIQHTLEIYHPNHLQLFDEEIFPQRLQLLQSIPAADHRRYVFSYNLRIKNSSGLYENYLQRNCFLSDQLGNPVYSMGILMNINHLEYDNRVIQTIDKIDGKGSTDGQPIHKSTYYLNKEDKLFSKREKEVLLWMSDGLSSKMIAEKMSISENTVMNHRKSMQDKSNMPNCTALVSFAIRSGII
jgi:DNA-binding CsgD family transcriptional regulator